MKRPYILGLLLVLVVAWAGWQQYKIARMELLLGEVWSNEFSGQFFSRLPDLQKELQAMADAGKADPADVERWYFGSHNMQVPLNNTLNRMRFAGVVPDVPAVPIFLKGYLSAVGRSMTRAPHGQTEPVVFSEEQRAELRRHAAFAGELIAIMKKHYSEWDGGFPLGERYFGRAFWSEKAWREAIREMDAAASKAGYPPS